MSTGNIEVINRSVQAVYANTRDFDMAIYTDNTNQAIHFGCGSNPNFNAPITLSSSNMTINGDLTLSNRLVKMSGVRVLKTEPTGVAQNITSIIDKLDGFSPRDTNYDFYLSNGQPSYRFLNSSNQQLISISSQSLLEASNINFTGLLTQNNSIYYPPGLSDSNNSLITSRDLLPAANIAYDLGTSNMRYRDLCLRSIDINGTKLYYDTRSNLFSIDYNNLSLLAVNTLYGRLTVPNLETSNINFTGALTLNGSVFQSGTPGLSNLDSTTMSVNRHFVPASNLIYDIGTTNLRFRDLYLSGVMDASNLKLGGSNLTTLFSSSIHTHSTSDIISGIFSTARLPIASTTTIGIVQLDNTVTNTSTVLAATANAVKLANDNANSRVSISGGTISGTLNATTLQQNGTNISSLFASSTLPTASTSAVGIVQLDDTVTSTSSILAATANAVRLAYNRGSTGVTNAATAQTTANAAMPKTGGNFTGDVNCSGNLGVGTTNPSFKTHINGSMFIGDISYASSVIPSTALTVVPSNGKRLVFDNSYDNYLTTTSSSSANKIVLHNADWVGGFGIESGAVTYHTGFHHRFFTGATNTSYGNKRCEIAPEGSTIYQSFYLYDFTNGTLNVSNKQVISSSDKRSKSNIVYKPNIGSLEKVMALKPACFEYNYDLGTTRCGFIAQDVETVMPDAIDGKKYEYQFQRDRSGNILLDENNIPIMDYTKPRYRGLDTSAILAYVVGAFQEYKVNTDAKIASLERKILQLEI